MTRIVEISNSEATGSERSVVVMSLAPGSRTPQPLATIEPGRSHVAFVYCGAIVLIADRSLEQFPGLVAAAPERDEPVVIVDEFTAEERELIVALRDNGVAIGPDMVDMLRTSPAPDANAGELVAALTGGPAPEAPPEGFVMMTVADVEDYQRLAKAETQRANQELEKAAQQRAAAEPAVKIVLPPAMERMTKAELQAFADANAIPLPEDATKAVMLDIINAAAA
jgi:hypothetical protein